MRAPSFRAGMPAAKGTEMAEPKRVERPLSPFMIGPYYRPQLTSMTSIITRITGNGLIVGTMLAVWWLLAAATSAEYFAFADAVVTSWFCDLVFTLSAWALWYHYLAGVRHWIFEKLGWAVIIGSVVLTLLTIVIV